MIAEVPLKESHNDFRHPQGAVCLNDVERQSKARPAGLDPSPKGGFRNNLKAPASFGNAEMALAIDNAFGTWRPSGAIGFHPPSKGQPKRIFNKELAQ
jgi:hypothetical protein